MLLNPNLEYHYRESNVTVPSLTIGTANTPGNNTKSAYTDTGLVLDYDCYMIWLNIHEIGTSAAAEDTTVDIGADPAGGTTFSVIIPDLLASAAAGNFGGNAAGGVMYFFPLFIKAGTKLGIRSSQNDATPVAIRVNIVVMGRPNRPELARAGTYVDAFGITAASSSGTVITPGVSAAEGAYTQLGSTTTKEYWFWHTGIAINDATMTNQMIFLDVAIGSATEKRLVIEDEMVLVTSAESISKYLTSGRWSGIAPIGSNVYGRASTNVATNDSAVSMAAYGVGG